MGDPKQVVSQLLSASQAETLARFATAAWQSVSKALEQAFGSPVSLAGTDCLLLMAEEAAGRLPARHLAAPLELTTTDDRSATAFLFADTEGAAKALGSEADAPDDEEQQTIVIASTILAQALQALNMEVLAPTPAGLVLALDDIVANSGSELLGHIEDPGLWLTLHIQRERPLTLSAFLPGTFLDVLADGYQGMERSEPEADFRLSQDELDAAAMIVDEPEPPRDGEKQSEPTPITAHRAQFAPLEPGPTPQERQRLELLADLELNVTVELGRTTLTVAEVLALGPGSIIELDRIAGEPVDILVNDRLVARGEVVVVDENFGVRVVEVLRKGQEQREAS